MYPIINSLLDTDLYKFTMMQCVLHQFPDAEVEYEFNSRVNLNFGIFAQEIEKQVDHLISLQFTKEEIKFLSKFDFFKKDFLDFLTIFKLQKDFIKIDKDKNGNLKIKIKGPWLHTILYDIPVLAIISELYFAQYEPININKSKQTIYKKIDLIKSHPVNKFFQFADFGTRRRFSFKWQDKIIKILKENIPNNFKATSNVFFAKKYNITPVGTMSHEFLQASQALSNLINSQKFALETWIKEYRGRLGVALTDIVGIDAFLKDFDLYFVKLFDGLRHDSGDPILWANKVLEHYKKLNIDTINKSLTFSDSLSIEKALNICQAYYKKITCFFGIGSKLTNDIGFPKLDIVIKMISCNDQPVAKISDCSNKMQTHNITYLKYLADIFNVDLSKLKQK